MNGVGLVGIKAYQPEGYMSDSQFMEFWNILNNISKKLDTLIEYEEKRAALDNHDDKENRSAINAI